MEIALGRQKLNRLQKDIGKVLEVTTAEGDVTLRFDPEHPTIKRMIEKAMFSDSARSVVGGGTLQITVKNRTIKRVEHGGTP